MPLLVELPDAAPKIKNKFMYPFDAECEFNFGPNLGDFISNGIVSNDQFESVLDGDPVIKHFQNMTINAGHTVTTTQRCKGMYLLIEGDLTVNGTLSMTARGAKAPGKFIGIDYRSELVYFNDTDIFSIQPSVAVLQKDGGDGGGDAYVQKYGEFASAGLTGKIGQSKFRGSGGGGGGGAQVINLSKTVPSTAIGKAGAKGTVFAGGAGGGGASARMSSATAYVGNIDGGKGGNGNARAGNFRGRAGATGGAGAEGPGLHTLASYSSDGYVNFNTGYGNGAGGLMILIVKGNIIINSTGKIESNGTRAPGIVSASTAVIGTGGGSGGGIVMIMHQGTVTNNGLIRTIGGQGGATPVGYAGGKGGDGHVELLHF